ncbi:MAG TPA: hypothetical protein VNZ58_07195 [Thermomicrobiales bacterium]|nr:hypothetical protein [Thermomicrobiales bacterium]
MTIALSDSELTKLTGVVLHDLRRLDLIEDLIPSSAQADCDYYEIPLAWFEQPAEVQDFLEIYLACIDSISDFLTYFESICEIHKRRRKYSQILTSQPFPTMAQVGPRSLLEFGIIGDAALPSWLTWRKWLYDLDNRSAQETGYLFEPILATSLGGTPFGARNSPVKRTGDPSKGRQVDCIVGQDAYEFKLRVTIAASGQGRFREELEFAEDCASSGFRPILLVLDPTPSSRLDELKSEYAKYSGRAYIGNEAWSHLESESGPVMATFVDKYVKEPIMSLDEHTNDLLDLELKYESSSSQVALRLGGKGQNFALNIVRREDRTLSQDM